jgi:hypothetical protein
MARRGGWGRGKAGEGEEGAPLSCQMKSFARSREKMNCRRGVPDPETVKGVPFSDVRKRVSIRFACNYTQLYRTKQRQGEGDERK